jgi:hypothetical protein
MKNNYKSHDKSLNNSAEGFMKITCAALVIASLAALFIAMPARAEDVKLSSRECKVLLLPEMFEDYEAGAQSFWAIVEKVSKSRGLEAGLSKNNLDITNREVIFIDTPDFILYKSGYILRRRAEDAIFNYTFKYRNADPLTSADAKVSPAEGIKGKTTFEEDVVVKTASLEHVFSKSGKADLKSETEMTAAGFIKVFPGLAQFNLKPQTALKAVNGIFISELTFDYGNIYFTPETKAKTGFTVWYLKGSSKPLIAEFSYKYKIGDNTPAGDINLIHHASDKFLTSLRANIKPWLADGQTKTGLIYKFNSGSNE